MFRFSRKLFVWGLVVNLAITVGFLPGVALAMATSVSVWVR